MSRGKSLHLRAKVQLVLAFALLLLGGGAAVQPLARAGDPDPALIGTWSAPFDIGVKGIHSSVLPNGKVLLFSYPVTAIGSDARVLDPETRATTNVSLTWARDIFCSGHSFLADGRLFVTGGHVHAARFGLGVKNTDFYDPGSQTFSSGPLLSEERWYPTNVELGNGSVLVFGGFKDTQSNSKATTVDSYNPATNALTQLPATASKALGNYPRLHLLGSGKIAYTGTARAQLFNPATNTWAYSARTNFGGRGESFGSVLLPGLTKVLVFGGTGATATAEVIDFGAPQPAWSATGSMNFGRVWANPVLLPDGKVLAVGGGQGGSYTNPVRQAEMYDPATGTWTLMASQEAPRIYHSTAVLLPDGRVLSAGMDSGTYQTTAEIYSPPYLFQGPRPTIDTAPASLGYGQTFTISTPDAASIDRVALLRPSSVTHSIAMDQRYVTLSHTLVSGNTLSVVSPANGTEAAPGPYMLFLVSSAGVPSVASWVDVQAGGAPPAPTITGFSPASGEVGTSVDVVGTNLATATGVSFNGVPASTFTVVSASKITAVVPDGASTGRIRVTAAGGTATSAADFVVTVPQPPPSAYRDTVLADGPAAYWRLGEASGSALDETGHSAGGSYRGGATLGVPGALANDSNTAVRLDGVDDYVTVPDNNFLDVGDVFTYELWIKRGATLGVTQRILHKGAGAPSLGFGTNNKIVLLPGGSGALLTASSTLAITDHNWHYVAATKSGAAVHIYVDGVDVTAAATNTTMTSNTTAFNIGRATTGTGFVDADVDEVAVYPAALTPQRVLAHYQAGRG